MRSGFLNKVLILLFSLTALMSLAKNSIVRADDIFLREYWMSISGNSVSDLTSVSNYPYNPSGSEYLASLETPTNFANDYGTRVRGYIQPPYDGNYTFWIASDNQSRLLLSTSLDPTYASLIASVPDWARPRDWDKYPSQKSGTVSLMNGRSNVLHRSAAQRRCWW